LPSTPEIVIGGAAAIGNVTARTLIITACLVLVAVGVFTAGQIRVTSDFSAREQSALQGLPIEIPAASSTYNALMAGASPTGDQAAPEVATEFGGAVAGCGSCDARHRSLRRPDESLAP
jgi:hypothetical protein